jgi:hypothetical protein
MGRLAFPFDAELTGPDRVVLNILQKEYEMHQDTLAKTTTDAAEDSDDSGVKHSEFVTPSPEGMPVLSLVWQCRRETVNTVSVVRLQLDQMA